MLYSALFSTTPRLSRQLIPGARALLIIVSISACSSSSYHSHVIVDTKGANMNRYYQDREECQHYTEQVRTGERVAVEAAKGGATGGAVGAVIGGSHGAQEGLGVGAIFGAARGFDRSERELHQVMRNCLRGRGYRVLN